MKSKDEFYRDRRAADGLMSGCKDCDRKYQRSEAGKAKNRRYARSVKGAISRLRYNRSKKGKATAARYRIKYPEKAAAADAIAMAVQSGHIPPAKELKCARHNDGTQARHYHHPDYSRPLYVIPLCLKCHQACHRPMMMPAWRRRVLRAYSILGGKTNEQQENSIR
jgi:hypothetical protein